ncbi:TlpA family protein disulfide reductase [Pontibacter actiniarum]|nr:TlpA disulfide reductase family protein [Pontibacter actiniarum]
MPTKKHFPGLLLPLLLLLLVLLLQLLPGWLLSLAQAQNPPASAPGLQVGQPLPDLLLPELVNSSRSSVRLSDFRGKLLLLDFYATWCSTSRSVMPRLDSLQRIFGQQLQILLVSYPAARDTRQTVENFLTEHRRPDGQPYALPSVVEDTSLVPLFPHEHIPHFAWITPDGKVGTLTGPEQVTEANIRRALAEGHMPPSMRHYDLDAPLWANKELPGHTRQYSFLHHGYLAGAPAGLRLRYKAGQISGAVLTNLSVLALYDVAKWQLYPAYGERGWILSKVDSADFFPEKSPLPPEAWKAQHLYSYDLQLPPGQADSLYRYLWEDLHRYSGYRATWEPRATECLALVRRGRRDRLHSKGGTPQNRLFRPEKPYLQNLPLSALLARLNTSNALGLLVVDATGYTQPVDLALSGDFDDLEILRRDLRRYGLDLVRQRRTVPLLVLRKVPAPDTVQAIR